ncbi:hypothetical protein [Paenibacillus segetis]|uniref:Uncharacterized protein n=1 Tax=Paenibacillus segetis TaxID=1325360 RepID=A0ABQ1Y498_9BACL|nr:hypothetical protein [Paenibacillus segetis]GGH10997.1 hypothetical protein GCM10008013_02640 [Paenibacillus segetis]
MNKQKVKAFIKDESGDFSVKGIAVTIAVILIIGFAVTVITGGEFIKTAVEAVWNMLLGGLQNMFGTSTP